MREIKFRAWDKKENRFWDKVSTLNLTLGHFNVDGFKWSQYTGLKDKNGKEIYEGDILDWGDNFNSKVLWNEAEAAWNIEELENTRTEQCPRTHDMNSYTYKPTVLGNIYENPELLANIEGIV